MNRKTPPPPESIAKTTTTSVEPEPTKTVSPRPQTSVERISNSSTVPSNLQVPPKVNRRRASQLDQQYQKGKLPLQNPPVTTNRSEQRLSEEKPPDGVRKSKDVANKNLPTGQEPKQYKGPQVQKQNVPGVTSKGSATRDQVPRVQKQTPVNVSTSQKTPDPSALKQVTWQNPIERKESRKQISGEQNVTPKPKSSEVTKNKSPQAQKSKAMVQERISRDKVKPGTSKQIVRVATQPEQFTVRPSTSQGPKGSQPVPSAISNVAQIDPANTTLSQDLAINFLLSLQILAVLIENFKQNSIDGYFLATIPYNLVPVLVLSLLTICAGFLIQNYTLQYGTLLVGVYIYLLTPFVALCLSYQWLSLEAVVLWLLIGWLLANPLTFYFVIHSHLLITPKASRKFLIAYITTVRTIEYFLAINAAKEIDVSVLWIVLTSGAVWWVITLHIASRLFRKSPTNYVTVRLLYRKVRRLNEFLSRQDPVNFRLFLIILYPGVVFAALKQSLSLATEQQCQNCFGTIRADLIITTMSTPVIFSMLYKRQLSGLLTDLLIIAASQLVNLLGLLIYPFYSIDPLPKHMNEVMPYRIIIFYSPVWAGTLYIKIGNESQRTNVNEGFFTTVLSVNQMEERIVTISHCQDDDTLWTHETKVNVTPGQIDGYHVNAEQLVRIESFNKIGLPKTRERIVVNEVAHCGTEEVKLKVGEDCETVALHLRFYKNSKEPFKILSVSPPERHLAVVIPEADTTEEEYRLAIGGRVEPWEIFHRNTRVEYLVYHIYERMERKIEVHLEEIPFMTIGGSENDTVLMDIATNELLEDLKVISLTLSIVACGVSYNMAEISYLNFLWHRVPFTGRIPILFTYFTSYYLVGWLGRQFLDQLDDDTNTVLFMLLCFAAISHMIFGYKYNKRFPSSIH